MMEGWVEIGANVAGHLNLADVEFRLSLIASPRIAMRHDGREDRGGQTRMDRHPLLEDVAEVDEPSSCYLVLPLRCLCLHRVIAATRRSVTFASTLRQELSFKRTA